ncbi:MAG: hypothetical protein HUU50_15255 [Candidatus Brocadiae bacterium]|nr:hypothetical protein [Candidatus Brocadiia bacterium]
MNTREVRQEKQINTIAKEENNAMQYILEKTIDEYKNRNFFLDLKKSVIKAKKNQLLWEEELEERKKWESTLSDGWEEE